MNVVIVYDVFQVGIAETEIATLVDAALYYVIPTSCNALTKSWSLL
jgi:hypothetical protein